MLVAHGQRTTAPVELFKLEEQRVNAEFQPKLEQARLQSRRPQAALDAARAAAGRGWRRRSPRRRRAVTAAETEQTEAAAAAVPLRDAARAAAVVGPAGAAASALFGLAPRRRGAGGDAAAARASRTCRRRSRSSSLGVVAVGGVHADSRDRRDRDGVERSSTPSSHVSEPARPSAPRAARRAASGLARRMPRRCEAPKRQRPAMADRRAMRMPRPAEPRRRRCPRPAGPRRTPSAVADPERPTGPAGRCRGAMPKRRPQKARRPRRQDKRGDRGDRTAGGPRGRRSALDGRLPEAADSTAAGRRRRDSTAAGGDPGDGPRHSAADFERSSRPRLTPFVVREYAHQRDPSLGDVRADFTETVYWHPVLVLPESGKTTVEFQLSDDIARYQVLVAGPHDRRPHRRGHARPSRPASRSAVDPKLPLEISHTDTIDVPVRVTNDSDDPRNVAFTVTPSGLKPDGEPAATSIDLGPNGKGRKIFRLNADQLEGDAGLRRRGHERPRTATPSPARSASCRTASPASARSAT